jgi:hypothetical protein
MRNIILATVMAATCVAPLQAQMVSAPPPDGAGPTRMSGFVGARVRISLGGTRSEDQGLRAGLTIAPMQRREGADLRSPNWRIGEGLEFGFRGKDPAPQLSIAGQPLKVMKQRSNLSGGGTTTLVIVGLALAVGVGLAVALGDSKDDCTGGECNNN